MVRTTLIPKNTEIHLIIPKDYVGKSIDSIISQKVKVHWREKDGKEEVVMLE